MAILSTFKSFEKYIPVGGNWQLVSERTNAKDIIFDDSENLATKYTNLATNVLTNSTNISSNALSTSQEIKAINDSLTQLAKKDNELTKDLDTIENRLGTLSFTAMKQSEYNALSKKDSSTLYIIYD